MTSPTLVFISFNEDNMIQKHRTSLVICVRLLVSIVVASAFIALMDFGLIRELYKLYYGDSEVSQFFKEQAQNVFQDSVRVTSFKLVLYRAFYSMVPIAVAVFLMIIYHSKSLPHKILGLKVFEKNKDLARILQIGRYALALGVAFLILVFGRDYFYSTFHNCLLGYRPDFVRVIFACTVFVLLTCDLNLFIHDLRAFPRNHRYLTLFVFILLISILSFAVMEFQIGSKTDVFVYLIHINIMYWLLLQLVILGITRNPKIGAFVSLGLAYMIGLANDIVCQFRGNYIMFGDLTVVRTAMEVAGNYTYRPSMWFWLSLGLMLVSVAFVIFVKLPTKKRLAKTLTGRIEASETEENDNKEGEIFDSSKPVRSKWKKFMIRTGTTLLIEASLIAFIVVTFRSGHFYGNVFGVGWNYNENVSVVGYLPYFFSNMDATRNVVVDGYSAETAKLILEEEEKKLDAEDAKGNTVETAKTPNIIVVQNEAFSDLRLNVDLETDVDPMPFIHGMKENTQKGYMNMSVTGGPTSNTEFEVLSRASLQYFPYGSVPYTQYLKHNISSVPEVLKHQDTPYHTVAYHSYYSSGYNRNSVYDYLGFDQKKFENDFFNDYPESDLPREYLSDEANYRKVIKLYEENKASKKPFFCFNVTIQGHGGYTGGPYDLGEHVNVTNFEATESMRTYLSLIKKSDTAFKGLVEYFEKVDEPTIIFMYGDHQPSFDDEAKELLEQHPAWDDEMMQAVSAYYVPYIIWANFDIEEYDYLLPWDVKAKDTDKWAYSSMNKLSTNYASTYVMRLAGVKLTTYDHLLLDLHEEVPAITAIGVWDKAGNYYGSAAESPDADRLHDLEIVQYNLIFDDEKPLTEYYLPKDD